MYEFIYENFITGQDVYFDIVSLKVASVFDINYERGESIFCVHKWKNRNNHFISFPDDIDLQKLMQNIKDITSTMFTDNRYREYTISEMIRLST